MYSHTFYKSSSSDPNRKEEYILNRKKYIHATSILRLKQTGTSKNTYTKRYGKPKCPVCALANRKKIRKYNSLFHHDKNYIIG